MKKTLVLILSVMMVLTFALTACGGGSGGGDEDLSDSQYVGTWKASSMDVGDESVEADDAGEWTLTLNGDGTGTVSAIDADGTEESYDVTWTTTGDGFKTMGDTKMTFKDDGEGGVTSKILGVEMHFTKVGEGGEESVAEVDGSAYGYAGTDPVECAVYKYMVENVAKEFDPADASIPTVSIVSIDDTPDSEILVYGDYWVDNYKINGETLESVSGGNFPGVMHVSKDNYEVTAFDQVAEGEDFDSSAKELFGDNYDAFMSIYGDDAARAELRKLTVSDYVKLNGLAVTQFQDYGWDPVALVTE